MAKNENNTSMDMDFEGGVVEMCNEKGSKKNIAIVAGVASAVLALGFLGKKAWSKHKAKVEADECYEEDEEYIDEEENEEAEA